MVCRKLSRSRRSEAAAVPWPRCATALSSPAPFVRAAEPGPDQLPDTFLQFRVPVEAEAVREPHDGRRRDAEPGGQLVNGGESHEFGIVDDRLGDPLL